MAKTLVVEPGARPTKMPFLRGILTRSLQEAGLSFDDAYTLASEVRDTLSETTEITTDELREIVLHKIESHGTAVARRYEQPEPVPSTIVVRDAQGHTSLFSREQHRRVLESSGLSYEQSTAVVSKIFAYLTRRRVAEIQSRELGFIIYRYLRLAMGPEVARRYLVLVRFLQGDRPLVLMIGGAPGTGKSVVATEIAQRLEIVRIQSTDLLREVMRMMLPARLLPVLHRSSYDAWQALPGGSNLGVAPEDLLVDGYRAQAELLSVPCEGVLTRSLHEHASVILEGVHVQRALIDKVPAEAHAIVVPIMLAVLNPERLRARFLGREKQLTARRAGRYLEHFDSIWRLQSYLLSEADRWQTPIIVNNDREQVVREVMATIVRSLSAHLVAEPAEVFT